VKTSLGIWAFGGMATRFNPGGYKPELAGIPTAVKVRTAVEGLGDLIDDYEFHYPQELSRDNLDEVQEALDGHGIYCIASGLHLDSRFAKGGFCSPDDATRAEALRLTVEGIDLAAEVGAHFIIWPGIEGYNYPFQTPYASSWQRLIDAIGQSARHASERGVAVFLEHKNSEPAMAHIEAIFADGKMSDLRDRVRIPASPRRITVRYTGLSLAIPERVRFRYTLDSFDRGWSEPVAAREAVYTNLSPGFYRFRVIASNSDGLWNGAEALFPFEVEPMWWQTWWFRLCGLLFGGFVILALYRMRLHQQARQLNLRFEERLAERTRIAQDLHDTLLQGVLSASMQLHVANDQLSAASAAKPIVVRVLDLMGHVIDDGRNTLRGLRSSGDGSNLEQAFSQIPQELSVPQAIDFRVLVEGQVQPLHPVIRDQVYRIGREAMANAFRHARATSIEVELEYANHQLRVLVRDNGCGIDPRVLRSGRDGHWGLSGMRERAEAVGAGLKLWSRIGGGTEVELSVPGQVAYRHHSLARGLQRFTRLNRRKVENDAEMRGGGPQK